MNKTEQRRALSEAVEAAKAAGALMTRNQFRPKRVNESFQHDIKLELDVRCQKLIERRLLRAFPGVAILGEEGVSGDPAAAWRWVIDPIDGTVNFTYGIPHACVSIALQRRLEWRRAPSHPDLAYETVAGVVHDPFTSETFTALLGGPARLNGRVISVGKRSNLDEAIVSVGFAKSRESLEVMLPEFNRLVHRVRKIRIMGAAALAMVYVASGRFDAYIEGGIRLWDIAAGGLILECAGGEFWRRPVAGEHTYAIVANNGLLRRKLTRPD